METLSSRLRALRKEKNITLDQMAESLNTNKVTLSRYETGVREPKQETLNMLANYFNVSVDYLFCRTNEKNPISKEGQDDVIRVLDDVMSDFKSKDNVMFDGEPMNQEEFDSFLQSLEVVLTIAKQKQEQKLKNNKV
ncbi:MAG: helix-turn-helix transcriptional regulator [Romboutsia sp.]